MRQLGEPAPWSHVLIARRFYKRPAVAFLDESSSAMDEGLEQSLYTLLRRELPDTLLISVGHRHTLAAFHSHQLDLDGKGGWQLSSRNG